MGFSSCGPCFNETARHCIFWSWTSEHLITCLLGMYSNRKSHQFESILATLTKKDAFLNMSCKKEKTFWHRTGHTFFFEVGSFRSSTSRILPLKINNKIDKNEPYLKPDDTFSKAWFHYYLFWGGVETMCFKAHEVLVLLIETLTRGYKNS